MKLTINEWVMLGGGKGNPRQRRGAYSYQALADAAKVSWSTIYRIANRKHVARKSTAAAIRAASGNLISYSWLIGADLNE